MSGGAYEYTMANIVNTDGTTMKSGDSGFTTTTYPDAKYYDKYSYSTSDKSRKRSKLGDGIKEVLLDKNDVIGWYTDYIDTPNSRVSWFVRGYYFSGEVLAGLFSSIGLLSPHSIASTMHPSICSCNIILLTPFNADITAAN